MSLPEEIKNEVTAHYNNAWEAQRKKDFETALTEIEKAIKLVAPRRVFDLLITKGDILREQKKYSEAEDIALVLNNEKPDKIDAWKLLGLIYFDWGKYILSAEWLRRVIAMEEDSGTLTLLGNAELTFDPKAALKHAEKALELDPEWAEALRVQDKAKKILGKAV